MALYRRHLGHSYEGNIASGNARVHYGDTINLPPERPPPAPLSTVPFPRDPDYINRKFLTSEIRRKLAVAAARVALIGLGGVGKSQLAIEYAHRVREESPETWVFWLYASSATRFELSVRDTLNQLELSGSDDPNINAFQLFRRWLRDSKNGKWLIILDNADDAQILLEPPYSIQQMNSSNIPDQHTERRIDYLPTPSHGSILLTSRSWGLASKIVDRKDVVVVDPMGEEHAVQLVEAKLGRHYPKEDVIALVRAVDFMPLAITQAVAYISSREPRCTLKQYLESLYDKDRSGRSLLDFDAGDLRRDREASNSIFLTWQISFQFIQTTRPSAADLLSLMSIFDRQSRPETLLHINSKATDHRQAKNTIPKWRKKIMQWRRPKSATCTFEAGRGDETRAEDDVLGGDIEMLRNYSFISATTDPASFEMHRLVQVATQKWLEMNGCLDHWRTHFMANLDAGFPDGNFENWDKCRPLFPHTMIAVDMELKDRETILRQASLLFKSGWYAQEQGTYVYAKRMEVRSMDLRMRTLGPRHPDTATSMTILASTDQCQGNYTQAAKLGEQVLEINKRVLGPEHPDTATSMGNLASAYKSQGKFEQAAKLGEQVLEIKNRVLGPEHPDTVASMSILALTYQAQGKYEQAAKLGEQVLEINKRVLGPEHPDTATSMSNLASTYQSQGKYEQAAKIEEQLLKIKKRVLGPEHPDTAASIDNLI